MNILFDFINGKTELLSLAEKVGCTLYTGDKRFFNALKDKTERIQWIGNYVHA